MKSLRKFLKAGRTPRSTAAPTVVHSTPRTFRWKPGHRKLDSDETSSTEGSGLCAHTVESTESKPASLPWVAENFLENGPPQEADWWQDDDGDIDSQRFVNRGLATWTQGRAVWKSSEQQRTTRPFPHIPESFRRDLIKCLSDRRQFELSQRIPLSTMIDAYQEVWKANE